MRVNPALAKASSEAFIDFSKLKIQPHLPFILLIQHQPRVFLISQKNAIPTAHSPGNVSITEKKDCFASPGQPQFFCPGRLLLYSPNQSDLICISELNTKNNLILSLHFFNLQIQNNYFLKYLRWMLFSDSQSSFGNDSLNMLIKQIFRRLWK